MPLNIKDEMVHEKAKLLAKMTGQSITAVVREAIDEKLQNVQAKTQQKRMTVEEILALAKDCKKHLPKGVHSADHADLYDDEGMPA
jgi:antitoxin VapB